MAVHIFVVIICLRCIQYISVRSLKYFSIHVESLYSFNLCFVKAGCCEGSDIIINERAVKSIHALLYFLMQWATCAVTRVHGGNLSAHAVVFTTDVDVMYFRL